MAKKKKLIPFWVWPANWGLDGTRKEIAEAEYYLEGEELQRRLIDLTILDEDANKRAHLRLDLQVEKITQEEYDYAILELDYPDKDSIEYKLAVVEMDLAWEKITEREARKLSADIKDEPWFEIVDAQFQHRPDLGSAFHFELDWNEKFIEDLIAHNWSGPTPEAIVDQWFTATCQDIFTDFENTEISGDVVPFNTTNRVRKSVDEDKGKAEYS